MLGKSEHHLFTYYEVRKKLIQDLGEPVGHEEHLKLHAEIKRVQNMMPKYLIDHEHHMNIHKGEVGGCTLIIDDGTGRKRWHK